MLHTLIRLGVPHLCLLFLSVIFTFPLSSNATPKYAEETGFTCETCHTDPTGGSLIKAGEDFKADLQRRGRYRPLGPAQKVIRLIVGYLHLLMAIARFGTILYVHILLKPAYAAKGLPKGELALGWIGIITLSVTGVFLTVARIPTWQTLFTTRFGILLSIKIFLFLIMITTAFIVTFFIGRKLRSQKPGALLQRGRDLSPQDLLHFDGKEGNPAYLAYRGKIYDVSLSKLWKDGSHMKKHYAGADLTDLLKLAPHEEEQILRMPEVGTLIAAARKSPRPIHERVFYFMAYLNLVFVFLITFVIALWRWW